MKRAVRACLFAAAVFLVLTLILPANGTQALTTYDSGYYIKDYRVDVVVNTDRSYDITETLTVHFNEPRHGIKRNIPTWADLEREVRLENVSVEGADYEYDGYGNIKIGSADYTVEGDIEYIIRYTLWHYADEEPDADYVYLNLIGTEWDTYTEHYSCGLTLPKDAVVQNVTLTGGSYGSTDAVSQYTLDKATNTIEVFSDEGLNAYEGVTINIALNEGAFPDAEIWTPTFEFLSHTAKVTMDEYGVVNVTEDFTVKVNKGDTYYMYLSDIAGDAGVSSFSSTVAYPDGTVRDSDSDYVSVDLRDYEGQTVDFSISYVKAYSVRDGQGDLRARQRLYNASSDYIPCNSVIELSLPFEAASVTVYPNEYSSYEREDYSVSGNGKEFTITVTPYPNNSQDVLLETEITNGQFVRDMPKYSSFSPLGGLVVLLIGFFASMIKPRRPSNPVPEFYPPDGMTPPETGYILKNTVKDRDMSSMIYYWASKKLLKVTFTGKDDFILNRTGEDENYEFKPFEKHIFDGLWTKRNPDTATDKSLSNRYYRKIETAIGKLIASYGGKDALIDHGMSTTADIVTRWLPTAFAALLTFAASRFMTEDDRFTAVLAFIIIALLIGSIHNREKARWLNVKKRSIAGEIVYWLWTAVKILIAALCFAAAVGGYTMRPFMAFLTMVLTAATPLLYRLIARRSDYGNELLDKVEGFRLFLDTAEKERLRMLLDENPEYYYDILPYAQVLGITKQWAGRFDDILMREPEWLDNRSGHVFTYRDYNRMNQHFVGSMTSRPASSGGGGGGGFSGGGGGGSFSGGGFSGGGSGGGGGSSW